VNPRSSKQRNRAGFDRNGLGAAPTFHINPMMLIRAGLAASLTALRHAGPDADPREILTRFRRGGTWWSQDLALALYLAMDEMVPGCQARVFGPEQASARALLAEAVVKRGMQPLIPNSGKEYRSRRTVSF
jgi:hypothetical protein